MPVEIFFSYAHEDEHLMDAVRRQLVVFERQGQIIKWHDRQIPPGAEWEDRIDGRLRSAHIILLFVSPAFLESRYCWDIEVTAALQRHSDGDARVVPIILRPCAWDAAPFAVLQALPIDARPLSQWPDLDQASLDVARAIMDVVAQLQVRGPTEPASSTAELHDRLAHERILQAYERLAGLPPGAGTRHNWVLDSEGRLVVNGITQTRPPDASVIVAREALYGSISKVSS